MGRTGNAGRWLLLIVIGIGCGRVDFEPVPLTLDAAGSSDATSLDAAPPDATPPSDAAITQVEVSFGQNGRAILDQGEVDNVPFSVHGIAVQPDGRIIVVGKGGIAADTDALVARLRSDGSLDPTFGTNGITLVNYGLGDGAHGVALQPDGKIVIGINGLGGTTDPASAVARLDVDGSLDLSFGVLGISEVDFPGAMDAANGILVAPDGKLIFGGQTCCGTTGFDIALARLDTNGQADLSFGSNLTGAFATDLLGADEFASPIAMRSDGSFYVFANTWNGASNFDFAVLRYTNEGVLDASFGSNGSVVTDFSNRRDSISDLAVYTDGRIVSVGRSGQGATGDFAITRHDVNGVLDLGFADAGTLVMDLGGEDFLGAVQLTKDGRIALGGTSNRSGNKNFIFLLLHEDGTLDTSVGIDGVIEVDIAPDSEDTVWGMSQTPAGDLVLFGKTHNGVTGSIALLQITL